MMSTIQKKKADYLKNNKKIIWDELEVNKHCPLRKSNLFKGTSTLILI